jgi:hypothetical protein
MIVSPNLSYIAGNYVVVVDTNNVTNKFTALVSAYSVLSGMIVLIDITSINGNYGAPVIYEVNLSGIPGTATNTGATGVTGPTGQVVYTSYIFDGGSSTSVYTNGPAFDCGTSV